MRLQFSSLQRDRLLALCAGAFAASLIAGARGIEDSLLADEVGAGGVPQGVGLAMAVAALALFAKSFMGAKAAASVATDDSHDADGGAMPWHSALLRTTALVLILLVYAALLPRLGYPLSLSLLVGASGWLAGAAPRWPLWLFAVLSGPSLWLLFDQLLQVRMPVGTVWGG